MCSFIVAPALCGIVFLIAIPIAPDSYRDGRNANEHPVKWDKLCSGVQLLVGISKQMNNFLMDNTK